MKAIVNTTGLVEGHAVAITCPHCRKAGIFPPLGVHDVNLGDAVVVGHRRCPNPQCKAHVFILRRNTQIITYPPTTIDFDASGIPDAVRLRLEEAITCHASECYIAAGMLVRRTLEELCEAQGVSGKSLNDRLDALRTKVIMPPELFAAMHDLRLLGNDAAHIEAKTYAKVGREEVEAGIELTKEILKACYQMSSLLQKLRKLKVATA